MLKLGKLALEIVLALIAAVALLGTGIWLGWKASIERPKNVVVTGIANGVTPSSTDADLRLFWEAWATINENYLRNPSTTNQQKVYGAIDGLAGSLNDPYTQFFTPVENRQFKEDIKGNF